MSKRILYWYLKFLKNKAKNTNHGDKAVIRFLAKRMFSNPFKELFTNVFYEVMDQYRLTRTKEEMADLVKIWQTESDIQFRKSILDTYNFLNSIRRIGMNNSIEFPTHLDGAQVLEIIYLDIIVDTSNKSINEILEEIEYGRQIKFLAICQYFNDPQNFYLFHVNRNFKVIWDTAHITSREAKEQAEYEYPGSLFLWKKMDPQTS